MVDSREFLDFRPRLTANATVPGILFGLETAGSLEDIASAAGPERLYEDSSHMVAAGTELMAKAIVGRLDECRMLPPGRG